MRKLSVYIEINGNSIYAGDIQGNLLPKGMTEK